MRIRNSIRNVSVSIISYAILMITTFIIRSVFAKTLGLEIVGIDGLYLHIISIVSIAELGIGVGIVYKLYKPVHDKDNKKISILLNFYKKAYFIISIVIITLGSMLIFVIPNLIKEAHFSKTWLGFTFFLYVIDLICSYLFAHKRAMFIADQKNFINNIAHVVSLLIACILQVIALYLTGSFVVYIIIKSLCAALEGIFISIWYNKNYSYINTKINDKLPLKEKKVLFKNIKALLYHNIGNLTLAPTSSMIITYFVNTESLGIYSNYVLLTTGLNRLTEQIFNGIIASFGNLLVTSSKENIIKMYKHIYFLNHLIYSFLSVGLCVCINSFISLWIGKNGLFPFETTLLIAFYFYLIGMKQSISMVKQSAGIYNPDKYCPIIEMILSVALSLILVHPLGINGVLIANIISMILVSCWTQPYVVYKNLFQQSALNYYKRFAIYISLTVFYIFFAFFICNFIKTDNLFLDLLIKIFFSALIPSSMNLIFFYKSESMLYLKNLAYKLIFKKQKF